MEKKILLTFMILILNMIYKLKCFDHFDLLLPYHFSDIVTIF